METKPALKVGVRFWRTGQSRQLRIGTRHHNIALPDQFQEVPVEGLLKLLNGTNSITQIAKTSGLTQDSLAIFVSQLKSAGLLDLFKPRRKLDLAKTKVTGSTATIAESIGSRAIRQAQLEIEQNAITLLPGIEDGGAEALDRRNHFEILIFGTSRIAITLLGALRAAGFTKTNLIDRAPRNHPFKTVQASDLMGGFFRNSEILQKKAHLIDNFLPYSNHNYLDSRNHQEDQGDQGELETNNRAADLPTHQIKNPHLIISVGAPSFDAQQRWLSEGTPHLLISFETSGEIRLGPFVLPGQSACLTCIEMSEIDAGLEPRLRPQVPEIEVSAGLALFTAGAALLEISRLVTTGRSELLAKSLQITSDRFIAPISRLWQFHPLCGCRT